MSRLAGLRSFGRASGMWPDPGPSPDDLVTDVDGLSLLEQQAPSEPPLPPQVSSHGLGRVCAVSPARARIGGYDRSMRLPLLRAEHARSTHVCGRGRGHVDLPPVATPRPA